MQHAISVIRPTGFLRLPEVLRLIPVSKSTWWAGVRAGRYPSGVKLSPHCTAWRREDIIDFIENAASRQEVAQ